MEFSLELALALIESDDPFPVDFDDAWQWIGWPKKQHGKDVLTNNFIEGIDFLRKGVKKPGRGHPSEKKPGRGRPGEWIVLTVDCFKSLGMMAGTPRGREIRRYFLECEQIAKATRNRIPAQLTPQEAIDFINQARDLLSELCGELEERDRIMLSDVTRNAVLRVQGAQLLLPAAEEITISDRVVALGYRPARKQLMNIGRIASQLYQDKHGKKPGNRTQYVDGAPRKVKSYCSGDLDIVDAAIQRVMGEEN